MLNTNLLKKRVHHTQAETTIHSVWRAGSAAHFAIIHFFLSLSLRFSNLFYIILFILFDCHYCGWIAEEIAEMGHVGLESSVEMNEK